MSVKEFGVGFREMKRAIFILVIGLFWCSVGFALTQQQLIDQHLSNRKLDLIEGVWTSKIIGYEGSPTQVLVYYKSGNIYKRYNLSDSTHGSGVLNKSSDNYYYGTGETIYQDGTVLSSSVTINIDAYSGTSTITDSRGSWTYRFNRIWPTDIVAHNAKFKTKKDIADEEKVVAVMVADARKICKVLGFEDGSEKMADCTLKLYTQKVDELVAERQAANALMTQSQTTTTTQSSGSNVTTIYDPVRDSRALMQQGQKMLSGGCTLGIDC